MEGYLPAWVITVITLVGSTIITTIVGLVIKAYFDKYLKRKERETAARDAEKEELAVLKEKKIREERKSDMISIVSEIVAPINEKIDAVDKKLESNSVGTVTLLRDRMKSNYDNYVERGYASDTDKANWIELYNSYKALGGNHFREYVDQWRASVLELPTKKSNKRSKN